MPVVDTTITFQDNDQVTASKLNSIMDNSTFVSGAVVAGNGLEVVGGQLRIGDGSNGITTAKIADSAITTAKIENSTSATTGVTTAKIANSAVTTDKIANSTSTTTGVTTAKIADSNITTAKIADANITAAKLNGAQTGVAPIYGARAWCVFDATKNTSGVVSTTPSARLLIAKGNVSSVVRNSLGRFTVNFEADNPMPGSYAVIGGSYDTDTIVNGFTYVTQTASSFVISTENTSGGGQDFENNSLVVFG